MAVLESVPVSGALVGGVLVNEFLVGVVLIGKVPVGGVLVSVVLVFGSPLAVVSVEKETAAASRFVGSARMQVHRYTVINAAGSMVSKS
jgi:hypothetical protein